MRGPISTSLRCVLLLLIVHSRVRFVLFLPASRVQKSPLSGLPRSKEHDMMDMPRKVRLVWPVDRASDEEHR